MIFLLYLFIPIGIDPVETNEAWLGFAKPVGTVPGGTDPARYTNRSGSHL
jgi:hypothetical protein